MSNWKSKKDREEGAWQFVLKLDQDKKLRKRCLDSPQVAKTTFKKVGQFTNMPDDVEVRVLEDKKSYRDKIVIMALPPFGKLPPRQRFRVDDVWICCWRLWPAQ